MINVAETMKIMPEEEFWLNFYHGYEELLKLKMMTASLVAQK